MRLSLALIFGVVSAGLVFSNPSPPYSSISLVNQHGTAFTLDQLGHEYVFLTFFFSRCRKKEMCPLSIRLSKEVLESAKASKIDAIKIVGVTLDPVGDSSQALQRYAQREGIDGKNFWLATAPQQQAIDSLAAQFNVVGLAKGPAAISHNVRSVLLAPNLRFIRNFDDNEWRPTDVIEAIQLDSKATR